MSPCAGLQLPRWQYRPRNAGFLPALTCTDLTEASSLIRSERKARESLLSSRHPWLREYAKLVKKP